MSEKIESIQAITEYAIHSETDIFPSMSNEEFRLLKADIKKHGQKMAILVYRNKIVDGRQRLRACRELGIEPWFTDTGKLEMPTRSFIVSQNLHRRHLGDGQRALIAAKLVSTKKGANQHTAEAVSQKQAAKVCHVSIDSVQRAMKVLESRHDGLLKSVENGELDISSAAVLSSLPTEELDELAEKPTKAKTDRAKAIRLAGQEEQHKQKLAVKKKHIAKLRESSEPFDHAVGPFDVIYADPPWDHISEVELGYPTMKIDAICDLLRDSRAVAVDSALFLWVPASLIAEGLKVIEAWGFRYVTQAIWHKCENGMGTYFRINHEVLMFAIRCGGPSAPAGLPFGSVISKPRGMHSQKPDKFYEVIESMYPNCSKMELFRRGVPREGWYCWGNEVQHGPAVPLGQRILDAMVVERMAGEVVELMKTEKVVEAVNDPVPQAA